MAIKVVVPISGGKDSQACLKLALTQYQPDEIVGLFHDTKFEHPLTYAHIDKIETIYRVEVVRSCAGSVDELVHRFNRFPGVRSRFCTDRLKIQPSIPYYKALAEKQGGFEVWYGMRAGESSQRAKRYEGVINSETYEPHELLRDYPKYLGKMGVKFRLPIIEWTSEEVLEFLGGDENPLYGMGCDRVGCFPCLASGDAKKEFDFALDDFGRARRVLVEQWSKEIGHSVWTSKGGQARNDGPGCSFCSI